MIAGSRRADCVVNFRGSRPYTHSMVKFLLWCILLILYWPLALLAVVLYPLVWVALIPFRIMGLAVDGVLQLVRGIVMLPARLLNGPRAV